MEDAKSLPKEPSRASGRWYVVLIFLLAGVEATVAMFSGYVDWRPLLAINILPLGAFLIAKAATSWDINKLADSVTRMVEAKYGNR